MRHEVDRADLHAIVTLGWRSYGQGALAELRLWNGPDLIADVVCDYPGLFQFADVGLHIGRVLDACCRNPLFGEPWAEAWDVISERVV